MKIKEIDQLCVVGSMAPLVNYSMKKDLFLLINRTKLVMLFYTDTNKIF